MHNIKSEEDYKLAEARLEVIAGAIPGTGEARELKALTQAIVRYLKNPAAAPAINSEY